MFMAFNYKLHFFNKKYKLINKMCKGKMKGCIIIISDRFSWKESAIMKGERICQTFY